jgi:hypothetical protein
MFHHVQIMKCIYIVEQCTDTDMSFWVQLLIRPPGWPVGWIRWDRLLSGVTPIQVQAHKFNWHQP